MGDRKPPAVSADEKTTLLGFLDYLRESILAKATGVPEPQIRTPGVASGTNLLGLIKHLTAVERFYFLGEDVADWSFTFQPVETDTAETVFAGYRTAVTEANSVIEACTDLTKPPPTSAGTGSPQPLRWLLTHMIEETGRHAGHADIIRELIDDSTGR